MARKVVHIDHTQMQFRIEQANLLRRFHYDTSRKRKTITISMLDLFGVFV